MPRSKNVSSRLRSKNASNRLSSGSKAVPRVPIPIDPTSRDNSCGHICHHFGAVGLKTSAPGTLKNISAMLRSNTVPIDPTCSGCRHICRSSAIDLGRAAIASTSTPGASKSGSSMPRSNNVSRVLLRSKAGLIDPSCGGCSHILHSGAICLARSAIASTSTPGAPKEASSTPLSKNDLTPSPCSGNICGHICPSSAIDLLTTTASTSKPEAAVPGASSVEAVQGQASQYNDSEPFYSKTKAHEQFWLDFEVRYRVIVQLYKMTKYNAFLIDEALVAVCQFISKLSPTLVEIYNIASSATDTFWELEKQLNFKEFEDCLNNTYKLLKTRFGKYRGRRHNPRRHTSMREQLDEKDALTRSEEILRGWKDKANALEESFRELMLMQVGVTHTILFIDIKFKKDLATDYIEYKTGIVSLAYKRPDASTVLTQPKESSCAIIKGWMFRSDDERTVYRLRYWELKQKFSVDTVVKVVPSKPKVLTMDSDSDDTSVLIFSDLIDNSKTKRKRRRRKNKETQLKSSCHSTPNSEEPVSEIEDWKVWKDGVTVNSNGEIEIHSEEVKIHKYFLSDNEVKEEPVNLTKDSDSLKKQWSTSSDITERKKIKKIRSKVRRPKARKPKIYKNGIKQDPIFRYSSQSKELMNKKKNLRIRRLCWRKNQSLAREQKIRLLVTSLRRNCPNPSTKNLKYMWDCLSVNNIKVPIDNEDGDWESTAEESRSTKETKSSPTFDINNLEGLAFAMMVNTKREIRVQPQLPWKRIIERPPSVVENEPDAFVEHLDPENPSSYEVHRKLLDAEIDHYDRVVMEISNMILKLKPNKFLTTTKTLNESNLGLLNELFVQLKKLDPKEYERVVGIYIAGSEDRPVAKELAFTGSEPDGKACEVPPRNPKFSISSSEEKV